MDPESITYLTGGALWAYVGKVIEITALGTIAVTPVLGGLFVLFSKISKTETR